MKISETIEHITEHWKLKGFFDDDRVDNVQKELKTNMLSDGSMVGHTPRWTCVIDDNGYTCSCPDHQYRGSMCKHLGCFGIWMGKESTSHAAPTMNKGVEK